MKYRVLRQEELQALEEEFKQFLIVHGIYTETWEELNCEQPEKAIQLIEIFSDTVLQKVYEKIRFVEFRSPETCIVFNCLPDTIQLISIQKKPTTPTDLSTPESIHHALKTSPETLVFFRKEKAYTSTREAEIHKLLEENCLISTYEFWDSLDKVC